MHVRFSTSADWLIDENYFLNYLFIVFGGVGALLLHVACSSRGGRGLLRVAVHGLLIAVAEVVLQSPGSRCLGFGSCGKWA